MPARSLRAFALPLAVLGTVLLAGCDDGALRIGEEARQVKLPPNTSATLEVAAEGAAMVRYSLSRAAGSRGLARSCPKREIYGLGPEPICGSLELVDAPEGKFARIEAQYGGAVTAYPMGGRASVRLTNLSRETLTWSVEARDPLR